MEELRDGNYLGDHLKSLVSELIFLIKQKRRKLGMMPVKFKKYILCIYSKILLQIFSAIITISQQNR